jgi:amino acid permease
VTSNDRNEPGDSSEMTPIYDPDASAEQPLLSSSSTPFDSESGTQTTKPSRYVEDAVLPETAVLGRNLSKSSAYILVISRVIGSGIFATPGSIVKTTGSVGLALLLWVVGALLAGCSMMITLEYGCMLPRSGGDKVYLEFTYQHPRFFASTLVAVQAVLLGFTASNCIVFGEYILYAFEYEVTEFSQKSLALGLLTVITVVHGCFLQAGIRIQNFLGWIKVGLILFMALTGIYVVLFRVNTGGDVKNLSSQLSWDGLWKESNWGWGTLSTAIFKVSYSYAGLGNINNVLNEVKDPVRTLKTVTLASLATACLLYLLVNFAYFVVVPLDQVKEGGELIAALFFGHVFGKDFGRIILPLAIAVSAAGNVMVVTFTLVLENYCSCTPFLVRYILTRVRTGSSQPRNRPPRLPPLPLAPLLLKAHRCTTWRLDRTLHPFFPRHRHPATRRRVQLHIRRGRISRTVYGLCNRLGSSLAEEEEK